MNLDVTDPCGTFDAVRSQFGLKSDTALAKALGYSSSSDISRARKAARIPDTMFRKLAGFVGGHVDQEPAEDEAPAEDTAKPTINVSSAGKTLPLYSITQIEAVQQRERLDTDTLCEYDEAIRESEGWPFPPVAVFHDVAEGRFILADGFHRLAAAEMALDDGFEVPVEIHEGGEREAILYACGCNAEHGLRRTNADKRRAVLTLLQDPEWRARSDNWVAEVARVSAPFVAKLRETVVSVTRIEAPPPEPQTITVRRIETAPAEPQTIHVATVSTTEPPSSATQRIGRDGRTTNTSNIGRASRDDAPAKIRQFRETLRAAVSALEPYRHSVTAEDADALCRLAVHLLESHKAKLTYEQAAELGDTLSELSGRVFEEEEDEDDA
jgi:hypothetical protein